jgi:hypothetical protein
MANKNDPAQQDQPATRRFGVPEGGRLVWKAVERRHYLYAQEILASEGRGAYQDYVLSLLESVGGLVMNTPRLLELDKAIQKQAVAAFEEEFKAL